MASQKRISMQEFEQLAFKLIDRLEEISQKYLLNDNDYKSFIEDIVLMKNNSTYKYIEKKVTKPRRGLQPILSLEQKINSEEYIGCTNCNAIIKKSFMKIHLKTKKCSTISQTKKTTLKTTKFKNSFEDRNLQLINEVCFNKLGGFLNSKNDNINKMVRKLQTDIEDEYQERSYYYEKYENKWYLKDSPDDCYNEYNIEEEDC